jgi:peptidoglycan/xylan/chitin deacetylase (PgdA/CDA1 family)
MTNIKVLGLSLIVLTLSFSVLSSPLYVSISFDVERDPSAVNYGETSFWGIEKVEDILEVMDRHDARGTFFVTGRVADRFPETLKSVEERGHEVGAHGGFYHEEKIAGLPMEEQKSRILQTKIKIESITGGKVIGYRAPGHRIDKGTIQALEELGFAYDSSVVPSIGGRVLYKHGILSPDVPYHPRRDNPFLPGNMDILEIPLTPVLINGNLDSLLAYQGEAVTKVELIFAVLKCMIKKKPLVLYLHPGMMTDYPNEPPNYRYGEYLIGEFDDTLTFLDLFGARYVPLEEINSP